MAIDLTTVHFTGVTFSLLFAVIFLSLHRLEGRELSLPFWAGSHLAYAARHAMHFVAPPDFYGPWFVPGLSLLFVGCTMLAALALAGRRVRVSWLVAASLLEVLWIAYARWAELPVELRATPIAVAVGGAMLVAAVAFAAVARQDRSPACLIAAVAHLIWSVGSFAVLFRTPFAEQFRFGVVLATLGSMAIAILVIIAVLHRRRAASDRLAGELIAARSRLESLIGTASDWIWEIDAQFRYTYLSDRFGQITGADARRLIGMRWDTPWAAHRSGEKVWAEFCRALEAGRPVRGFRHPAHMVDGRPIVLLINADPMHDPAGRLIGFRGTGRDATTEIAVGAIMDVFAGDAANRIGIEYFRALVGSLGATLNADAVFVARIERGGPASAVRTLAVWADGAIAENREYALDGTVSDCLDSQEPLVFLRDVRSLFVRDPGLAAFGAEGYAGIGLGGTEGQPLGVLAVISRHGFTDIATIETVLKVVAPRAAAELERQIADRRLRESEARFRDVIDHMPTAIGARDRDGRFVFVNRAYESLNGIAAGDLIGHTLTEAVGRIGNRDVVERSLAADARVLATGETVTEEYIRPERPTPDGPGIFLVSRFPIRDAAGEIVAVGSVALDITDRRIADTRLRESEARFRAVMEHMPLAFTARDLEGRHILANPAYEAIAGRSAEEMIGRRLDELQGLPPGTLTRFDEFDRRVVETNQAYVHEMDRSDARIGGQKSRFLVTRFPIRDAAGKIVAVGSVGTDINELKRIERELRASESRFRSVIEHMPLSFCVRDLAGRFLVTNPTYDAIGGISTREAIGRSMLDFVDAMGGADVVKTAIDGDATVIQTGQTFSAEIARPDHRRGGALSTFLVTRFPIRGADDQIVAVGSVALDITESRKAAEERRKSEALLRAVIDNLPVGFLLSAGGPRIAIANPAFGRILGLPVESIVGRTAAELRALLPDTRLWDTAVLGNLDGVPMPHFSQHVGPDPTDPARDLAISLTRFRVAATEAGPASYGVIVQDVTESWSHAREREARERAIQASEARFRAVVDNLPFGFSLRDREGRFLIVNRAYEAMLGLGARRLLGRTPDELTAQLKVPAVYEGWREGDRQVIETGETVSTETETPDLRDPGRTAATHIVKFPVFEGGNSPSGVATLAIDITGRRRMQQAIVAREAELHRVLAALDMAREGIVVEEASGRVLYANRAARALVEPSGSALALLQRTGHGMSPAHRGHWAGELALARGEGANADIAFDSVALADGTVVTVLDDVTDEKTQRRETEILERRLRRAEKMEALGRLAGGIAHDFNNLLGAIVGFAGFIAEDSEPGGRTHAFAERILAASDRAKSIVREVLAFSRPPEPRRQRIALGSHLVETVEILRPALPPGVHVEIQTHDPEIAIDADPAQLTQVVMNLMLNAADALEGRPGTIQVAADLAAAPLPAVDRPEAEPDIEVSALPDGRLRCTVGHLRPGAAAVIRVTDHGHGISRQNLERIFDPFFTTKTKGKGTGLGLPVVHGIVLAHHGAIVVHSRAEEGTTFEVLLPAAAAGEVLSLDVASRMTASGRGRILVVDDDEDFGDMVAIALGRAGYETAVVNDPAAALDVVGDDPTVWDLVITDYTMPGMNGIQLIERLAVLQPDLPCVLCSGFGIGVDEASAVAAGASAFLAKPIEIAALVEQVAKLIAVSRAA
ncbi:PAS domain S-box protein [Desertibaculum subflavum]|uniref:PAS domain S-box protein n=1 Tax=Desertibaculum subflavum TaxID=2268458 RepID=UPI000E674DF5